MKILASLFLGLTLFSTTEACSYEWDCAQGDICYRVFGETEGVCAEKGYPGQLSRQIHNPAQQEGAKEIANGAENLGSAIGYWIGKAFSK